MVSFIIPTLNSERTLGLCLDSILSQDVPRAEYEIVIADAGSSDRTLSIAKEKGVDRIVPNPLKTGEAGKAAAIAASTGELLALVDSDNILPSPSWLREMTAPFRDQTVDAAEPLYYTARSDDPALVRYFALLGMNDPLCLFTGNYDRFCFVTRRWTELPVQQEIVANHIRLTLTKETLPTIGANGFVIRRSVLTHVHWQPYFFDIDVLCEAIDAGHSIVAKVKTGIVHLYCSRLGDFARKQKRRIRDFLYFSQEKQRAYPWDRQKKSGIVAFCLCTALLFPLLWQMLKGCVRKPDRCWLYHVPVCWITLWTYGIATLSKLLGAKQSPVSRDNWQKVGK